MKFDSSGVAAVKARADIVDIVRRYVDLRSVGGRLVGVCPFHQETKGSFNVHPERGYFHCFGCQASGDVIDFYCRINGLEFREGLERLAAEVGVSLAPGRIDPRAGEKKRLRQACLEMHALADEFFRRTLRSPQGQAARDYLDKRGIAPEVAGKFGLGYSPPQWQGLENHLKTRGFSPTQAAQAGLLSRRDDGRTWDRFRDRLTFPIRDVAGTVVAFGGRIMGEGDPKYLNSADSPIYRKGDHLYALCDARQAMAKSRRAMLTEGYVDVITLHQFGYAEAVGVLGTALTPEQVKRLLGFCSSVDLIFDGDGAGRKAALRSAEMLLATGAGCRVTLLPEGEDVDSLLQTRGKKAFEACLAEAEDGLRYCFKAVSAMARKEQVAWAEGFLGKVGDANLRAGFAPRVAAALGLSELELRSALADTAGRRRAAVPAAREKDRPAFTLGQREQWILSFAARCPEYAPALDAAGAADFLSGSSARGLWAKLKVLGADDPRLVLEPEELAFVATARESGDQPEEQRREHFEEISGFLHSVRRETAKKELTEAMRRARAVGNVEEERRLFAELNALLGRGDE
ncbi:DNA primase [Desulfolutivibrio sulfoxidireducens]|uniref:DNA primase n=1 Tax=Desulfolutivibrio sulfoxidireducens TaxID=2773299 RepID=UPI00159E0ABD|nr:DNA primase [Desulfolutivibrio sulfoxidireducens]QLA16156.1 DNA primase [Desulfolutivibrio sulfoxidireducens]QLA19946.1 DNA primase [Desulfolutivibrio sulfoxidireducens]